MLDTYRATYRQTFPPKPTFTEKDIPPGSQVGRVFIITGANQGIGFELVRLLYPSGATIYLAGRSLERINKAISDVVSAAQPPPSTPAILKPLHLDLGDLTTVKPAAAAFAAQETRLDILWNNAGIGGQKIGATTKQNLESHIGVNCVAPLLFTQELLPLLQAAVKVAPPNSVRVIWTGSGSVDLGAPKGGVDFKSLEMGKTTISFRDYASSKVGNWFLAVEGAQRWGKYGIISVVQNPGNLYTAIWDAQPRLVMLFVKWLLHAPKFGAYTMLFSAFTSEVSVEKNNGTYIEPFGIVKPNSRKDIYADIANGRATEFWEWCEKKYARYT